ncbi:lyso-ornithine lipid acyltransferase [Thauera chlorobenzoica]|uniref:1-acyl-sn-glycerol-3-phosphate acyltransferase n=1 Tax=Thauera chlorobenzoica TaxID=96773 RepID=A0A1H5U5M5_9RHOO|nr:lysophospholipid acyltransferase family protein [Thauera chlorobenzoica]APR03707.1 1-acyl-sn-glycerol-3-phosphate acyltransferase [Thauera chlorobenzoica]SEF69587.1 lyso-ornithine lipid acyltransferase [Thauera chlorobenzoica]
MLPAGQGAGSTERAAPLPATTAATPAVLRAWRYLRLGLHLVYGVATVALVYPFTGRDIHRALRRRWSRALLRILGIELEAEGEPIAPGCLLVANHISWVDIFAINALAPAAFVSKAEVRTWPLIGWLAATNDTLFLRRGSRGHARIINAETAARLEAGGNVAIFPEGTTTDGTEVLHFHAALLQPAIACGRPVQPLALRYLSTDGGHNRAPAYDGDLSLGQCIANIIATRRSIVRIRIAPPCPTTDGVDRRILAQHTRDWVLAASRLTPAAVVSAALPAPGVARSHGRQSCNRAHSALDLCNK